MRALRLWPVMLRVGFAGAIAYRAEIIIWILTTTMPLVMLALWRAAAVDGPIAGFGQPEFVTYFATALVVRQLASSWIVWELNADIRTGTLSMGLLRPIHPIWTYVAENLGAIPMRVIVLLPVVGTLLWLLPSAPLVWDAHHVALFCAALLGAWIMTFAAQTIVGLLCLWTEQSLSIWDAWFGLFALLSGYLVPVELFPATLRRITEVLPFRAMGGLPVEILMGRLDGHEMLRALVIELVWTVVFILGARFTWQKGLRRFGAFGA